MDGEGEMESPLEGKRFKVWELKNRAIPENGTHV